LAPALSSPQRVRTGRSGGSISEVAMRIATGLVVIWLIIGVLAAVQRDYFSGSAANCARAGTILATIAAGPLNYVGVNPKIKCTIPQPSA